MAGSISVGINPTFLCSTGSNIYLTYGFYKIGIITNNVFSPFLTLNPAYDLEDIYTDNTYLYVLVFNNEKVIRVKISDQTITDPFITFTGLSPLYICIDPTNTYLYTSSNVQTNKIYRTAIADQIPSVFSTNSNTSIQYSGLCVDSTNTYLYAFCGNSEDIIRISVSNGAIYNIFYSFTTLNFPFYSIIFYENYLYISNAVSYISRISIANPSTDSIEKWINISSIGLCTHNSFLYSANNSEPNLVNYFPIPPTPISNICFPRETPILTDQGIIPIEKINNNIHTINNKKIVNITQTISKDEYLVCFKKNSLALNYPSEKTIMSKEHKILYKGIMLEANNFLNKFENVKKVKYNGEILYNVLMETEDKINVNNLICETLNPNNIIAKLYTSAYTQEVKNKIINMLNECINSNDHNSYKRIINRL
jgi:hypothetical protein